MRIEQTARRLANGASGLSRDLARLAERRDQMSTAATRLWSAGMRARHERLNGQEKLLNSLGYRQVLARGFALVRDEAGHTVRSVKDVAASAILDIEFADGHIEVARARGIAAGRGTRLKPGAGQGTLF